jgi:hypothetical protein
MVLEAQVEVDSSMVLGVQPEVDSSMVLDVTAEEGVVDVVTAAK